MCLLLESTPVSVERDKLEIAVILFGFVVMRSSIVNMERRVRLVLAGLFGVDRQSSTRGVYFSGAAILLLILVQVGRRKRQLTDALDEALGGRLRIERVARSAAFECCRRRGVMIIIMSAVKVDR